MTNHITFELVGCGEGLQIGRSTFIHISTLCHFSKRILTFYLFCPFSPFVATFHGLSKNCAVAQTASHLLAYIFYNLFWKCLLSFWTQNLETKLDGILRDEKKKIKGRFFSNAALFCSKLICSLMICSNSALIVWFCSTSFLCRLVLHFIHFVSFLFLL